MIAEFLSTYLYELLAVVLSALFGLLGMALKRMAAGFCTDQTKTALAKTAVLFVEQVFRDLHGADKLEKACALLANRLRERGIAISREELVLLIEAAVGEMNQAFRKSA